MDIIIGWLLRDRIPRLFNDAHPDLAELDAYLGQHINIINIPVWKYNPIPTPKLYPYVIPKFRETSQVSFHAANSVNTGSIHLVVSFEKLLQV